MKSLAAQKLRCYRLARNPRITQEEFGRRHGVTAPAVNHWENGERMPSAKAIRKMAADGICEAGDWYKEAAPEGASGADDGAMEAAE